MQLFAGELTNQNREYYKVNDSVLYCIAFHCISLHFIALHCIALHCMQNRNSELVKLALHGRHIGLSTSHHTATYLHRETLQNERVEGRSLLRCPKGRPQGHLRELPLRRKGRGEKKIQRR